MEPKNGGLEDDVPLKNWVIFRFQPLILNGVIAFSTCIHSELGGDSLQKTFSLQIIPKANCPTLWFGNLSKTLLCTGKKLKLKISPQEGLFSSCSSSSLSLSGLVCAFQKPGCSILEAVWISFVQPLRLPLVHDREPWSKPRNWKLHDESSIQSSPNQAWPLNHWPPEKIITSTNFSTCNFHFLPKSHGHPIWFTPFSSWHIAGKVLLRDAPPWHRVFVQHWHDPSWAAPWHNE